MVILDPRHTVRSAQQETDIITTQRLTTAVTLDGKSVEEATLELVGITDCGPDLFQGAEVSSIFLV